MHDRRPVAHNAPMPHKPDDRDLTALLMAVSDGESQAADALLPIVYEDLRRRAVSMMRRESAGITLQPTMLVHDAFMRLIDQDRVEWQSRSHFFALASKMMRRVLVDHARRRHRLKRGGDQVRVTMPMGEGAALSLDRDADVLALDEALEALAAVDPRQADIVVMRFFGGMTVQEVAEALGVSKRTVEAEWTMTKAWLRRALSQ